MSPMRRIVRNLSIILTPLVLLATVMIAFGPAAVGASGIAVGFGRIWIASPPTASVVVLDPGSGRVLREIGVGGEPSALATGAGAVWVTNRADGTVSMIDPESGSVRDLIPIGREPEGIAVDSDAVWVTNGGDGSLVRLNPSTGETTQTLALDNPPHGVALTPDGVYVAVRSTGIEHRGGTLEALLVTGPQSLDPAIEGFGLIPVLTLTNDGLVGFRRVGGVEGSQLVPNLAVALPAPTDGGRTYTFQCARASATRMETSSSPRTSSARSSASSSSSPTPVAGGTTRESSGPTGALPASRVISPAASRWTALPEPSRST